LIPVKLALRNFLSYTEIHEPLVFDGIHVACLSGENGAGKSTLLDAITWVLWGESRARSNAQLVHAGRSEMEVELEFDLAGARYRVVRKWTARGSKGSGLTVLDLAIADGGAYRSISGNSVLDTEKRIVELLRMTYDTFTNSSFILQNRADTFALATPTQRKTVLAEILELAEYDRLQERAGREVREREQRHRELEGSIREADAELARRAEYEEDGERLTARVAALDEQIKLDEALVQTIRERLALLMSSERDLHDALKQAEGTQDEVTRLAATIREHEAALKQSLETLARAADIEAGFAKLQQARAGVEDLVAKLGEFARLCDERNRLDNVVTTARTRLESELKGVGAHLARVQSEAARLADHERAATKARADLDALAHLQVDQQKLERELAQAREDQAETRGSNGRLKGEMTGLRDKITQLDGAAICPICRSALDPAGKSALVATYTTEGKAQKAEFRENEARLKQLDADIAARDAELAKLQAEAQRLGGAQRQLAQAEEAVAAARRAADEATTADKEAAKLRATLERADFAAEEQVALRALRQQLDALGYDEPTHCRLRGEASKLAPFEQQYRGLEGARQAAAHRQRALDEANRQLARWQARLAVEQTRIAALREQTRELPAVRAQEADASRQLGERRRAHTAANRDLGEARQRLAYLERLAEQRKERLAQLDAALRDKAIYAELQAAFGKNGIQAMLIESAIPEIEDEANRLLGSMSDGRLHIAFNTQRTRATGEGQIETLDIVINDELGARPYEMYSGGEAFRVNFAIRIALSKLLARRAGARLQTLVIDEGFGSQDVEGRERLVEAIKSIEDQFEMILVITHLDDLKERFPVRIDVRKTALGSMYDIEWAG